MLNYGNIVSETETTVTVRSNKCPDCGTTEDITFTIEGLKKYRAGAFIQQAFPELTNAQRERLMSGFCDPCWDKMFPIEDPDEYRD